MHYIYFETDRQCYKIYEVSVIISKMNFLTMLQAARCMFSHSQMQVLILAAPAEPDDN